MAKYTISSLKRFLPTSLFSRALLILVLPMIIMQTVALYAFYIQHWENVERHFSAALTGDIAFIVQEMKGADEKHKREVEKYASEYMRIEISRRPMDPDTKHFPSSTHDRIFESFDDQLRDIMDEQFSIKRSPGGNRAILLIQMKDYVLCLEFPIKRVISISASIFVVWMVGSAILLLIIATIFLRNQIRPIRKLAEVAEKFGKGQDDAHFRPQGASEVRQAGRSFIAMRERLKRLIGGRTEMLASISHDLRTPLTRMRLALAMLPDQKAAKPLLADVHDMEKMIQEYLDFARGKGGEQAKKMQVSSLLGDVVGKYVSQGKDVKLTVETDMVITVFHNAMCRCLYNVIDNALRYGTRCEISAKLVDNHAEITIDDNGPGIPADQRELAMQPFKRLDMSRNLDNSGTGLGLSIVQDIVLRHGGEVMLEDAPTGGLRVRINLPV